MEFLTDEQAAAYGSFIEEPTQPEMERFFYLDDVDRDLIALRRADHHRLGFAVQLCTVRYVGRFLEDPLDVPWPVALFDHAVAWLRRHRVLLPGVSVPARQVSTVREIAEQRLYVTVAKAARRADPRLPDDLVALLEVPEDRRISELERLRRPTRDTGRGADQVREKGAADPTLRGKELVSGYGGAGRGRW
ncbi:DUF4158 domain-containing protein [Streptosporangium amethystogenes]|uniref:DUF4158 domain-containing protein n=1 Tax=Streptosporangium amethystogenes TaxID=2002 RepID=UPI0037AE3D57